MTLPSTYQEVEYIQSSGTQYINTGYVPWSNTEVEMKFKLTNRNTSVWIYLYWCRNGASWADRRSFNLELYNNKLAAHAYSNTGSYERIVYTINDISLDTLYTLKQNDYWLYLDGTLQGTFASHNSYTVQWYNMALFCWNVAWTWGSFTSLKVYSMTIKDSWTLVRNFVPCYRKSDNVIWLYDLVNKQFYTNSWTWTFTKWPNVEPVPTYKLHWAIQTFHYQFEVPYSWEPDASRTLIYYPLTSNLVDQMWNWNTGTMHWTCTYDSVTGIHVTWMSSNYVTWLSNGIANRNTFTMNVWIKNETTSAPRVLLWYNSSWASAQCMYVAFESSSWINQLRWVWFFWSSWDYSVIWEIWTDSNWHNLCLLATWTTYQWYIDWVAYWTPVSSSNNMNNYPELQLWWWWNYGSSRSANWYIKDYIVENYAWSAEDITNYYNRSKSKVWL